MMEEKREKLSALLKSAPKPQLHLHLDGSLSLKFIKNSIERMKSTDPERAKKLYMLDNSSIPSTEDELYTILMMMKSEQVQSGSVVQKNSNWKVFDFCNQFLQTLEDLYEATYEILMHLHHEHGVNYVEIRFAPVLHTMSGLTEEEAVLAVHSGFENAKKNILEDGFKFDGGLILCALRSFSLEQAWETLDLVKKHDFVLGFDIAGDEGAYPLETFQEVISSARQSDVNVTVHAGEWNEKTHESVLKNLEVALECGVNRIGHGLALRSMDALFLDKLRKQNIFVEVCLTANCGNPDKCRSFAEHPVGMMLKNNVLASAFNCDNLLLSGSISIGPPTPTGECIRALLDCRLALSDILKVIENGYNAGFHPNSSLVGLESLRLWEEKYCPEIIKLIG